MSQLFKNKYRIKSARAQWWDYTNDGTYFITICAKYFQPFFGEITNNEIKLTPLGEIATNIFNEIPKQFPYIAIDEFIAMPDHIHFLISLDQPVQTRCIASQELPAAEPLVPNLLFASQELPSTEQIQQKRLIAYQEVPSPEQFKPAGGITGNRNPMLHDNLSRVIRWYKGRTSFECRKIHADFAWQPLFYDHIVRDEISYQRIKQYIIDNPKNWKK